MLEELHSIYPVYDKDDDDVVGVVDLQSIFKHIDDENFVLKDLKTVPF
jgi:putative hemolysin